MYLHRPQTFLNARPVRTVVNAPSAGVQPVAKAASSKFKLCGIISAAVIGALIIIAIVVILSVVLTRDEAGGNYEKLTVQSTMQVTPKKTTQKRSFPDCKLVNDTLLLEESCKFSNNFTGCNDTSAKRVVSAYLRYSLNSTNLFADKSEFFNGLTSVSVGNINIININTKNDPHIAYTAVLSFIYKRRAPALGDSDGYNTVSRATLIKKLNTYLNECPNVANTAISSIA